MGKKDRDKFIAKNDIDVLLFKKAFFIIVYIGLFIIALVLINTIIVGFSKANPIYESYYPKSSQVYDSYNYTFYEDTLYEPTAPTLINSTNIRNQVNYTQIYNATESFTNEINGTSSTAIDFIDIDSSGAGCDIVVIDEYNDHDNILELIDTSGNQVESYHVFDSVQTSGTIEFFWSVADATPINYFMIYDGATVVIWIMMRDEVFKLYDALVLIDTGHVGLDDTWYHIRIDYESGVGGYLGLGADEYYITINGERYGSYDYYNTVTDMDRIRFTTHGGSTSNAWFDAFGLKPQDAYYNISDNIIPYYTITNNSEVSTWDFEHTIDGNYSTSMANVPFWTEKTIGSSDVYVQTSNVITETLYTADGLAGIYRSFNVIDGVINISWSWRIGNLYPTGQPDAWYGMSVFSQSLNLLTQINITRNSGVYNLQYYNGSDFINLASGIQQNVVYNLSLFIENRICVLNVNDTNTYMFESLTSNTGLGKVSFFQHQIADNGIYIGSLSYIDYIGIYINGTALSNDYVSLILDCNVSTLIPHRYPYVDIGISGNYTLTLTAGTVSEVLREFSNYTTAIETINIYDFGEAQAPPSPPPVNYFQGVNPYFTFTTNATINISEIKIYSGILLTDGTNDYYSDITYYNLTTNDINFYLVDGELYYNATFNQTNSQYAYFDFYIFHTYIYDYIIDCSGSINQTGAYTNLIANYEMGSPSNFRFSNINNQYLSYLSQNRYLSNFEINITDDPMNNLNLSVTGYLNNFTVYYLLRIVPTLPVADTWVSLIIITTIIFPIPIIIFVRIKKRYPQEKHDFLRYLIPAITGCLISTAMYFGNPNLMPLFVYITIFLGFLLLILPSMLNRYLILGLMFISLMVYGGYFPAWTYVITLLIVSFTTVLTVKNMKIGDR
jgi:hypothetical protein